MYHAQSIYTEGDMAVSQSILINDLWWHGLVLKGMIQACYGPVPLHPPHLVARLTLLSTLGMHSFALPDRPLACVIFSAVHEYANGRGSLMELYRASRAARARLNLSSEFYDELLEYFSDHAEFLTTFVNGTPGEIGAAPQAKPGGA